MVTSSFSWLHKLCRTGHWVGQCTWQETWKAVWSLGPTTCEGNSKDKGKLLTRTSHRHEPGVQTNGHVEGPVRGRGGHCGCHGDGTWKARGGGNDWKDQEYHCLNYGWISPMRCFSMMKTCTRFTSLCNILSLSVEKPQRYDRISVAFLEQFVNLRLLYLLYLSNAQYRILALLMFCCSHHN